MSGRLERSKALCDTLSELLVKMRNASMISHGLSPTEMRDLRRNALLRYRLIDGFLRSGCLDPLNPMPPGDQVLLEEALTEAEGFVAFASASLGP